MTRFLIVLACLALCGCVELRGAIKCGSQGVVDTDAGPSGHHVPHCN